MEVIAVNSFRLVMLGNGNGFEPFVAGGDVYVWAMKFIKLVA